MRSRRIASLSVVFALVALAVAVPAAQAISGLRLTTPFPGITTAPDSRVSFDLTVDANEAGRVNLELQGLPDGWQGTLLGGGTVVTAVLLDGDKAATVRLDVTVPADASGTTRITVVASDSQSRVELPLDILVEADAGGSVSLTTATDAIRGDSDTTFTFTLQVHNDKAEDLTFTTTAQGDIGWDVKATPAGQTNAVSATVTAGSQAGITVTAQAPEDVEAGQYQILVTATVGGEQLQKELLIEVTGRYSINLSTQGGVLSARGASGSATTVTFEVTNTGTAPITNVKLDATPPTNWNIVFDPADPIPTIAAGEKAEITAQVTPAGGAIAGDYNLSVRATAEEANATTLIRFTVEAGILGAVIGGALIIAAFAGLWWVFRRYGRR